ncbi:histidine kinase dimerization/phospho-acceptor domain-containing protein [Streptomyces canus]|uniref:histidine kinase dimerization/phospho-acceptor domain-containing protein n=1 Tax=Streptomyces canus TaxID=58343 RepID=UPI0032439788
MALSLPRPRPGRPQTEVGRLSTVINDMLLQIETAFAARAASEARMRRFVADASNELRTPLVGIKASIDLYRMGALGMPADIDRTMDRIAGEAERLPRLVEDLLKLARLDETQAGPTPRTPRASHSSSPPPTCARSPSTPSTTYARWTPPARSR